MPESASSVMRRWIPIVSGLLVLGSLLAWEISRILALNHGMFVYTLDDPYIHLALAEQLQNGWYGVNSTEFSAPSSSILWPFLLVPGAGWTETPLLINIVVAVATVVVVARIVANANLSSVWLQSALVSAFVLVFNLVGLVLTGMEHSLQVLTVSITALGALILVHGQRCTWWLPVALVASVAIRYEDLAVAAPVIALMWFRGQRQAAIRTALAVAAVVGAFSAFLVMHGHPPMPSSVSAKSAIVGAATIGHLLQNMMVSLAQRQGVIVWALLLAHVGLALRTPEGSPRSLLHAAAAVALGMHVGGGHFGWLNRYEIYILTFGVLLLIDPIGKGLATVLQGRRSWIRMVGLSVPLMALAVVAVPYVKGLAELPQAAQNIYLQQYQMHRFATEFWKRPVAVNDLGYVSYDNSSYVLDLWGLGSSPALRMRRAGGDRAWITSIADQHNVHLAMIYNDWVGPLPSPWISVATMRFTTPLVSAARDSVNIYVRPDASADLTAEVRSLLKTFASTLPAEASITIHE